MQFNNEEHHDSHEFVSWLIDEINMNVNEDYKHFLSKKLQSKDYQKDYSKFLTNQQTASNDQILQGLLPTEYHLNQAGSQKVLLDKIKIELEKY